MFWVGEEGEGSNSPPRGVPGSAGGPQWLTPPGELFPPAFWQVWLSGLRSLRQKDEVEGWVVSQAQIRIPGGGYLTIEKIFFFFYFFQPLFLMYDKSMSTALTLWYYPCSYLYEFWMAWLKATELMCLWVDTLVSGTENSGDGGAMWHQKHAYCEVGLNKMSV